MHRDVKPENILLHGGHAMVADFGIALAVSAAAGGRMTETGLSLGTPHYMSPEQATAEKEITARSDVYSLGSVLYEMLTGNPPFTGAAAQQIIMKIITTPAEPVTVHRKSVPPNVAAAVAKSLEKLPADRFESAKAFSEALGNSAYSNAALAGPYGALASPRGGARAREAMAWLLAAAGIAAAVYLTTRHEAAPVPARLTAELPESVSVAPSPYNHLAISRDGRRIAILGIKGERTSVYIRSLDDPAFTAVRGSEGAATLALSPDGESLLLSFRNRGLAKLPILGGTPQPVVDSVLEGAWSETGDVVFVSRQGLMLAPADGSTPRLLLAAGTGAYSAYSYAALSPLPGGRDILVSRRPRTGGIAESRLVLVSTADGRVTDLNVTGIGATYAAGHLIISRPLGMVFSAPFSLRRRAITGPPALVLQGVATVGGGSVSELAVADNGTLVYFTGATLGIGTMVSVDRQGTEQPLSREDRPYGEPRVSPDGRRVVMRIGESSDIGDVWVYDLAAGSLTPLTSDKKSLRPEWSRDGTRVITTDDVSPDSILLQSRPWDGNGGVQTLMRAPGLRSVDYLGTASIGPSHGWSAVRIKNAVIGDIMIAPTDSLQALRPFVATPAAELMPRVSPSGHLLAYASNKSGRYEVYVRPLPGPGPEVAVSTDGGAEAVWSSDGASLFYRSPTRMMVATIAERPAPAVTKRDPLFVDRWDRSASHIAYDVFPDGKHFVMTRPAKAGGERSTGLTVLVNWPQLTRKQGNPGDAR